MTFLPPAIMDPARKRCREIHSSKIYRKVLIMTNIFGATSTTDEVLAGVDLRGKRALVTGVSAGLGVETARVLAAHGAYVVGAARDLAKAEHATDQVRTDAANGGAFELIELDLASLASVRDCADALMAKAEPFDLVIANAGVMACPFGRTADGFETQFGTNHLGHFVLVNRIASLMRPGARLVNLSSSGHRFSDTDLQDPNFDRTPYEPFVAYGRSKTANVLFAVEFDRRHKGNGIRATAVHPGGIATELGRYAYAEPDALDKRVAEINAEHAAAGKPAFTLKTVPQGAATSVWAGVVAPADAVGAHYCENCHVAECLEADTYSAVSEGVRPYALDPENAKALWAKSEKMVGETF
jgi:NAD(P)-dependent dehydrogenase (short-subunit alcohol dehydrogenase family)